MKKIISKKNIAIGISLAVIALTAAGSVAAYTPTGAAALENVTVEEILTKVITWAVGIAALVCSLVIVIAGVLWITAGGDDTQLGKARKMLIYGIIGLVIVLGAWALVRVATDLF